MENLQELTIGAKVAILLTVMCGIAFLSFVFSLIFKTSPNPDLVYASDEEEHYNDLCKMRDKHFLTHLLDNEHKLNSLPAEELYNLVKIIVEDKFIIENIYRLRRLCFAIRKKYLELQSKVKLYPLELKENQRRIAYLEDAVTMLLCSQGRKANAMWASVCNSLKDTVLVSTTI